nr:hypothetical protein [Tanacetum cinerariifolium]
MTANTCYTGMRRLEFVGVLVEMSVDRELKNQIEVKFKDKDNNVKGTKIVKKRPKTLEQRKVEEQNKSKRMAGNEFKLQGRRRSTRCLRRMVIATGGTLGSHTRVPSPNRVYGCSKEFPVLVLLLLSLTFLSLLGSLLIPLFSGFFFMDPFLRASSVNVPAICTAFWMIFGSVAATIPRICRARPVMRIKTTFSGG